MKRIFNARKFKFLATILLLSHDSEVENEGDVSPNYLTFDCGLSTTPHLQH